MDFAEKMCDHIAMIDHGKIILDGSLNEIKGKYAQQNISLTYNGDISFLNNNSMIKKISDYGNSVGIKVKEPIHIQQLLKLLVEHNIEVKSFNANDISLQEIFVELAGKEEDILEKEVSNV
jgi:ABC-2 type transport system ATP-binding protein